MKFLKGIHDNITESVEEAKRLVNTNDCIYMLKFEISREESTLEIGSMVFGSSLLGLFEMFKKGGTFKEALNTVYILVDEEIKGSVLELTNAKLTNKYEVEDNSWKLFKKKSSIEIEKIQSLSTPPKRYQVYQIRTTNDFRFEVTLENKIE